MKKRKKGFTLIELVLALAITAVIIYVGSQFVRVGLREFRVVSKEYAVQHGVRAAVTNISNTIKESTAVFAVGEDKFDPKDIKNSMKAEWSYIALIEEPMLDESGNPMNDKTGQPLMTSKLMNFVWVPEDKDGTKGFHKAMDVTPGEWRIKDAENNQIRYEIGFYRDDQNKPMTPKAVDDLMEQDKIVKVYVKGTVDGDTSFELNNEVIARNANQIVDSRPKLHRDYPITALSYRTQPLGELAVDAAVVFVVDISASMERNLAGRIEDDVEKQRATIMKKNAKKFVNELEKSGKIDLYFMPFATHMYGRFQTPGGIVDIDREYMYSQDRLNQPWMPSKGWVNGKPNEKAMEVYRYIKELYQGRVWTNPTSKKNVEEIIKKLDAAGSHELMQRDAHNSETRTKLELIRDIYLYGIRFLQQPYELGDGKNQASLAHEYIDKMLNPTSASNPSDVGRTNIGGAIREGYKILEKSNKKLKYLVLLSDGGPETYDSMVPIHSYTYYEKQGEYKPPYNPDLSKIKVGDTIPKTYTQEELDEHKNNWAKQYNYKKDEKKTTDEERLVPAHGTGDFDKDYELDGSDMLRGGDKNDPDIYKLALRENPGKGAYNDYRFKLLTDAEREAEQDKGVKLYKKRTRQWLIKNGDVRKLIPERPALTNPGEFLGVDIVQTRPSQGGRAKDYLRIVMSGEYGMNVKRGGEHFIKRTFLIGFADDADSFKKIMQTEIVRFSEAGGGTEITEYKDASSDVSLEKVFKAMTSSIQDDMWYFVGP